MSGWSRRPPRRSSTVKLKKLQKTTKMQSLSILVAALTTLQGTLYVDAARETLVNTRVNRGTIGARYENENRSNSKSALGWAEQTLNIKSEDPTRKETYQALTICDSETEKQTTSWAILPFVEKRHKSARYVNIELKTMIKNCASQKNRPFCRENVDIYFRDVNDDDWYNSGSKGLPTDEDWVKVGTTSNSPKDIEKVSDGQAAKADWTKYNTKLRIGPIKKKGFLLAFRDTGSCTAVGPMMLYYNYCPAETRAFAKFSETMSGRGKQGVQVGGQCVRNTGTVDNKVYRVCSAKGEWEKIQGSCHCGAGYHPKDGDQQCVECPRNTYKQIVGNEQCRKCPQQSHTDDRTGATECTCVDQYYRMETETPDVPCTSIPSAPEQLKLVSGTKHVLLTWKRPAEYGGRFDTINYRIQCHNVDTDSDCDRFSEKSHIVQGFTSHKVDDLTPNTRYTFTVIAYNKISRFYFSSMEEAAKSKSAAAQSIKTKQIYRGDANEITSDSATLTWPVDDFDIKQVLFEISSDDYPFQQIEGKNSITLNKLNAGQKYKFVVRPRKLSNLNFYMAEIVFTTPSEKDAVVVPVVTENPMPSKEDGERPMDMMSRILRTNWKALLILVGIIAVVLAALCVVCRMCRNKRRKDQYDGAYDEPFPVGHAYASNSYQSTSSAEMAKGISYPLLGPQGPYNQTLNNNNNNPTQSHPHADPADRRYTSKIEYSDATWNIQQYPPAIPTLQNGSHFLLQQTGHQGVGLKNDRSNSTIQTSILDEKYVQAAIQNNVNNSNNSPQGILGLRTANSSDSSTSDDAPVVSPQSKMLKNYVDPVQLITEGARDIDESRRRFVRELNLEQIEIQEPIGKGHFGTVYKGTLRTETGERKVAIKQLGDSTEDPQYRATFLKEAAILGQIKRQANVVYFEGVQHTAIPAMIVTEYMEHGDLETFTRKNCATLTDATLLRLLSNISTGMQHLAENARYIHRDLSARNCLVGYPRDYNPTQARHISGQSSGSAGSHPVRAGSADEGLGLTSDADSDQQIVHALTYHEQALVCKIADFGLAVPHDHFHSLPNHRSTPTRNDDKPSTPTNMTEKQIPLRWTAPEAMLEQNWSEKSDVWSFGVLVYEVMSRGERPFWNLMDGEVYSAVVKNTPNVPLILQKPLLCRIEVYQQVVEPCFQYSPESRPKFSYFTTILQQLTQFSLEQAALKRASAKNPSSGSNASIAYLFNPDIPDPKLPLPTPGHINPYSQSASLSSWLSSITPALPSGLLYELLKEHDTSAQHVLATINSLDAKTTQKYRISEGQLRALKNAPPPAERASMDLLEPYSSRHTQSFTFHQGQRPKMGIRAGSRRDRNASQGDYSDPRLHATATAQCGVGGTVIAI